MNYFVLTNDPDHGQTENYKKIFRELSKKNIFVTTAVFCTLKDDKSFLARHCFKNETHTLDDLSFRKLMLSIKDEGHEIAYHGYSQVSDTREEFSKGLEIFHHVFKEYPKVYIEHGGHPKSHPLFKCKKENLALEGSIKRSRYFVKDFVKEMFSMMWTQEYLMDKTPHFLPVSNIFNLDDGILYFKRWRMAHFKKCLKNLSGDEKAFVGYTHFGYRGYQSKFPLIDIFHTDRRYEWWSNQRLYKTVRLLSESLDKYRLKPTTLSGLFTQEINNEKI